MSEKGFVSIKSLVGKAPATPQEILAEIRQIYFKTTRKTIENDFDHAIDLLKTLPDEEMRDKAAVYMEGLAALKRELTPQGQKAKGKRQKERGQKEKGQKP